jgi:hypothetical protein
MPRQGSALEPLRHARLLAKPTDDDDMTWAPMPPPIANLEREFRVR